jgi:predicted membrane protein
VINALVLFQICCFQACAVPSIARIVRRGSSADLSVWREILIICGACAQLAVMVATRAAWQVKISPVLSLVNIGILLGVIVYFRSRTCGAT